MVLEPVILPIPPVVPLRTREQVAQQRDYARLALRDCARLCGAPESGWEKNGDGRPCPNDGYYWSVSHKPKWVAAVIARQPVGIDIEEVRPRPHRLHAALAERCEWELLGDDSWHAFYRLWTAKEAVLKATGVGLAGLSACHLVEIDHGDGITLSMNGTAWRVGQYEHDGYIAAVTCGTVGVRWRILTPGAEGG